MSEAAAHRLTIDLGALARNWRTIAETARGAECAAVVKADAYGIGIDRAVPALTGAGCRTFFVATPAEGVAVRAAAPEATIHVLDGLIGDAGIYAAHGLGPVLGNRDELAGWTAFRQTRADAPEAALHVDTGMNRLGLATDEARSLSAPDLANAGVGLLMSHLACADTPDHPLNAAQGERFAALRGRFPAPAGSLCNSAGIFLGPAYHHDLVRPGIALYGGASHPAARVEPVVTAEAEILQVRSAPAGETVGYGAAETLFRDSRIAILAAGYADGYHRAAGSRDGATGASVAIAGNRAPLIGRVSMDLIAVDVTDLSEDNARRGAWAELFGPTVPLDEVAACAGTIGYELLTGLSRRAARRYVD